MNFPETVYTIDVLVFLLIALMAADGLRRGFCSELALTITLSTAVLSFCFLYPFLTQRVAQEWAHLSAPAVQVLVALVMGLLLFLLYFPLRAGFRRAWVKEGESSRMERVGGFVFGACRGFLEAFMVLTVLSLLPSSHVYAMVSDRSVLGGWVCERVTPWLHPRLMEMPVFGDGEG